MAMEDGSLGDRQGQDTKEFMNTYIPFDPPDLAIQEKICQLGKLETNEDALSSSKSKKQTFPPEIAKALLEDPIMKRFLDQRKLPRRAEIEKFLEGQPDLPPGKDWHYVMQKMRSNLRCAKARDATKRKRESMSSSSNTQKKKKNM